ncbi:MAG: nucleotidyl transferase AbiEii/AbiGii toxin family protein [Saprospiraceae bacterium]|nr:nucleotidyl transferase AbiEii/AbiGii toxin family protein [Saprospiraceae bacterium]
MNKKLYTDIVAPQLLRILKTLMASHTFDDFRLVGGTALSLYRGHRVSVDIDVISRGGRKKDFWDIHELMDDYSIKEMLVLHEKRYPYTHDKAVIKANLCSFTIADEDFDPICLRNKHLEIIKLDMIDFAKGI